VVPSTAAGRSDRLGMLDVLRFVAAFAVIGFHFVARDSPAWGGPVPSEVSGVGQWAAYGRLGVPLFFVISGFVILMSSWGKDVPTFAASRVGRLYPAYWVSVVLSVAISFVLWPAYATFFGGQESPSDAVLNLTMVQQAFGAESVSGVYWTLWYEARFYLLIAVLMLVGMTRGRVLAFAALWPVLGAVADEAGSDLLTTLLLPTYAPFFAGGMLLYVLYRDGHDWGTWLLVGLNAAIALHFSLRIHENALAELTPFAPSTIVIALLTVACFGLVAVATLTRAARWNARWMVAAGALTYPVYLVHENLGWFVIAHLRTRIGAWGAVLVAVAVALVAAWLLHRFVEKPFGPRLRTVALDMLRRTTPERALTRRDLDELASDDHEYDDEPLAPVADDRRPSVPAARLPVPPSVRREPDRRVDDDWRDEDDWREQTLVTSPMRLPRLDRDDAVGAGHPTR
jgi:peptidoglycan/LPS O-acetylase OafA/YrhL